MTTASDSPFFFTWTAQREARPFRLSGGAGAWFWGDAPEQRWLDLGSLVYQANAGHGHPRMIEAIKAQADRLCLAHPAATYPEKHELAERLLAVAPEGFSKVFFTLGGSDANEHALKIARLFTGRPKFVARQRSYHGTTLGALSLTGDWRRPPLEPLLPGIVRVADFDCTCCPNRTRSPACDHEPLSRIPDALSTHAGEVAAVVVESVVGANGVLVPPPGYMAELRRACDASGALLIVDEVLTGFGRTGRWFAFEHFDGVVPDLITCGKALTAGYGVLGAVLVHERIARHFETHPLVTGLTHYAHPLGVAAALEALRVYEEEGLVQRADQLAPVLRDGLETLARKCSAVRQSRSIGLLSATELDWKRDRFAALRSRLDRRRIHAHVQSRVGALILAPPLCIEEQELRQGLEQVGDAIMEVAA